MRLGRVFIACTLFMPSTVSAGLAVTLIPTPSQCPFDPGQPIRIDVYGQLMPSNGSPSSLPVEFLRFDFSSSDREIPIDLLPTHTNSEHGAISFWNFGTITQCAADSIQCGAAYSIDDTLSSDSIVEIALNGPSDPSQQIFLHQDRTTLLGSFEISYPMQPGTYVVDVLNAIENDGDYGAEFHGDDIVWRAAEGEIVGGRLSLTPPFCIPEPAGLVLLLSGAMLSLPRKRN